MPGKLPIDRVRASKHAPKLLERTKRRAATNRAKLQAAFQKQAKQKQKKTQQEVTDA